MYFSRGFYLPHPSTCPTPAKDNAEGKGKENGMERNGTGHGVFGFAKCDGGALKRASLGRQYNGVSSERRRGEKVRAGSDPGLKEGERERETEDLGASLIASL